MIIMIIIIIAWLVHFGSGKSDEVNGRYVIYYNPLISQLMFLICAPGTGMEPTYRPLP